MTAFQADAPNRGGHVLAVSTQDEIINRRLTTKNLDLCRHASTCAIHMPSSWLILRLTPQGLNVYQGVNTLKISIEECVMKMVSELLTVAPQQSRAEDLM